MYKKYLIMILTSLSLFLFGCTSTEQSGVKDTVKFMTDFNKDVANYKADPSKENLSKIVVLVSTTDIELNEEEKKAVDLGLEIVKEQAAKSGQDALAYWDENKEEMYSSLLENGNVLKDTVNDELQNYLNDAKDQGVNWLKGKLRIY